MVLIELSLRSSFKKKTKKSKSMQLEKREKERKIEKN